MSTMRMTYPAGRARLIRYLARGGAVRREDCGGAVGVLWCRVSRTGQRYEKLAGDRLTKRGFFVLKGVTYVLTKDYADAWHADKVEENDVRGMPATSGAHRVA